MGVQNVSNKNICHCFLFFNIVQTKLETNSAWKRIVYKPNNSGPVAREINTFKLKMYKNLGVYKNLRIQFCLTFFFFKFKTSSIDIFLIFNDYLLRALNLIRVKWNTMKNKIKIRQLITEELLYKTKFKIKVNFPRSDNNCLLRRHHIWM